MFLSRLSLRNPVMITMATIAVLLFGLFAIKTLGMELIPSMDFPVVSITTVYKGADAKTIEEDVIKEIEDAIGTLNDIKHINSTAIDNMGLVVVIFQETVDGPFATQSVRDKMAIVKNKLPDDADDPLVEQFDINAQAVVSLILKAPSGEKLSKVTRIADKQIKNRLQSISGVGNVDIYGGRERELRVLMDPLKINQLNISALDLIQLMKSKSVEIPAGSIKLLDDMEEVSIKSTGEVETAEQMMEIPLLQVGKDRIRVKDIARVEDGLEEEESASFYNLEPAVALKVKKQGSVNLVKMSEKIGEAVEDIKKNLPEGYDIAIIGDQAPFTKAAVASSISDVFIGALLAMLIIYAFLMNKRAAIIVAVSLPTSIIGTFLFLKAVGLNLNIMTTIALSISVGILTDDAIVVIEAIFRHLKKGKNVIRAAIDATNEVGLAVVSAELALICVFAPTIFISGLVGELFGEFGIAVVAAILISMTVSFTVTPLLSTAILKIEGKDFILYRIMDTLLMRLERLYTTSVAWVLNHRAITLLTGIAIFIAGIMVSSTLPTAFFPEVDRGEFDITVELPNEASIDTSKTLNNSMVEELSKFDWEEFTFSTMGGGTKKEKNVITIRVMMIPKEAREIGQVEAMNDVRKKLKPVVESFNAKLSVTQVKAEGVETSPVQVDIVGAHFKDMQSAASQLAAFMEADGGFSDIIVSDKGYKKEVRINFNHEKMSDLGINPAQTGLAVRALISGEKISGVNDETGEEVEFVAYIDDAYKKLDYLRSMPLTGANGVSVRLADVADITYGNNLVEINRIDRQKKIGIKSSLTPGYVIGPQAEKLIQFAKDNFPVGTELKMAGDTEHMKQAFTDLIIALTTAIFLIYIVLASQFNSFIHPLTIMIALPFAITGAAFTLLIFGQPFSIFAFIGIIMLMGIVTKNSILLVDYTLQLVRGGMEVVPALLESSKTRLRPILMTAGGTILGMTPVVLSTANAAEIKHSLGFAVIGGLIFSTFITLIIVPVIFSLLHRFTRKQDAAIVEELKSI